MAKEKLLLVLVTFVLVIPAVSFASVEVELGQDDMEWAEDLADKARETTANISAEDLNWARDLAKSAREITMSEIKQKYSELQRMLGETDKGDDTGMGEDMQMSTPVMRVYVSTSMNRSLLKNYVEEAKLFGAVLVFKGLPNGSWIKLSELVADITGGSDDAVAIQIDDFNEFDIRSVPSFVLSRPNDPFGIEDQNVTYDKVVGNIGIKGALEQIAADGELKSEARQMLKGASNRRW